MMLGTGSCPALLQQSTLEKYLAHHLKSYNTDRHRLQCHVLTDRYMESDWSNESLPSCSLSATEYLQARHLILVSQVQTVPQMNMGSQRRHEGPVLVMGMCVVEYAGRKTGQDDDDNGVKRSYIQYVDTTGLMKPRSLQGTLTRTLVKAYIHYARDLLRVGNVHLFASPKPSLLFAGSEEMGKKGVLGGRQLISWWLALLTETLSSSDGDATVYAYGPGEELLPVSSRHTRQCIERLGENYNRPNLTFKYGVPYRSDQPASSCIPAFQDDPKWRHLEAMMESESRTGSRKRHKRDDGQQGGLTVREFFETLSYRTDFAADHAALICATFHHRHNNDGDGGIGCLGDSSAKRMNQASCVLRVLQTLTFESEAESFKSSGRILALLRILGHHGFTISSVEGEQQCRLFKEILQVVQPSGPYDASPLPLVVQDVQSMVKRKAPRHHCL